MSGIDTGFAAALAAHREGRLDVAAAGYRAVLRDQPGHPHANNNLAVLLRAVGGEDAAVACYREAIRMAPEDGAIRSNLACALSDLGRAADAAAALRVALALSPDHADAWFNAGALRNADDVAGAEADYRRALRLKPGMGEALSNLGDLVQRRGESSRAIELYRAAMAARPDLAAPVVNLGEALKSQGRIAEAIAVLQDGVARHPDLALLHSNLLFALHYTPWVPPEVIARAHAHWAERHARPLMPEGKRFANDRSPGRRLRVGYVSPDFRAHACAHFIEALLRGHDRAAVEVIGYPTGRRRDAVTERLRALTDGWRPLAGLDDATAAALVERDRIDILVDLAGHTAEGRPLLFARRPAPVQVTWLGYPDTTGVPVIDARLTDAIADPPGLTDGWHAERLIRLPKGFLAFQPSSGIDAAADPPALANGFVTFGSFNNAAKVTTEVLRVWSAILKQVPSARLVLKSAAFADPPTRARWIERFSSDGIAPERIDLLPPLRSVEHHLRAYDRIDIALDPFPYTGTTTSCEALWMGVPVVTLTGRHHVSRVGASLLSWCGVPDLIAADDAGYVRIAAALATDLPRLGALRRGLRGMLERSPLLDHRGFARTVEDAYRGLWHCWIETAGIETAGGGTIGFSASADPCGG